MVSVKVQVLHQWCKSLTGLDVILRRLYLRATGGRDDDTQLHQHPARWTSLVSNTQVFRFLLLYAVKEYIYQEGRLHLVLLDERAALWQHACRDCKLSAKADDDVVWFVRTSAQYVRALWSCQMLRTPPMLSSSQHNNLLISPCLCHTHLSCAVSEITHTHSSPKPLSTSPLSPRLRQSTFLSVFDLAPSIITCRLYSNENFLPWWLNSYYETWHHYHVILQIIYSLIICAFLYSTIKWQNFWLF